MKKVNISILSQEDSLRVSISLILKQNGFIISSFPSYGDILSKFKHQDSNDAQLIITDIPFTETNGNQFIRNFMASENTIPILVLTEESEPDQNEKSLNQQPIRWLSKPFDAESLLTSVKTLLGITNLPREEKHIFINPCGKEANYA